MSESLWRSSVRARAIYIGFVLALLGCAHLEDNFRVVERGRFYRSGQMSGRELAAAIRKHGIQTVLNLRHVCPEEEWYRREIATCAASGVTHVDLEWSKNHLPEPESLARFVALCAEAETPMLVHCQGGTHRTGIASACYVICRGGSVEEARGQLGPFFGHAPIGGLLDLYEGSAMPFSQWVEEVYPGLYATLEEREDAPSAEAAP